MEKRNLSAWKLFLRILLLFSSLSIEFTPSNFSIFFLYQRVHSLLGLDPGVAIEIESVTAALSSVVGGARFESLVLVGIASLSLLCFAEAVCIVPK